MPEKHCLDQAQLESLTSPTRLAIIQRLDVDKEATARELALRMGRPVTSLYHHLKHLEDVELVRVVSERKGARRPEAVYAPVSEYLSSAEVIKTESGRKTYSRSVARVTEAAARTFSAALAKGDPKFEGEERNTMLRFYGLRATKEKMARLNALLNELDDTATQSCEDGAEFQLTIVLSPMPPKG